MREIKFRAYIKKQNKMVEITEISFRKGWFEYYNYDKEQYEDYYCTDTDEILNSQEIIIMQYAGIKDKNGVKIFEGDIVKDEKQRLFVIEYKFGGFNLAPLIYFNDEFSWNPLGDMQTAGFLNESCEVIGNTYENHELLEVEDK